MFCPKCGNESPENSIFCYKCGTKILVEEIKKVNSDTANIAEQSHVKKKAHFVMKKIFVFPILGTVLFVFYYSVLQFMNDNGYRFVGISKCLYYLIPISITIVFYIIPLVITFKNRKVVNVEVKNEVGEEVNEEINKMVVKKKNFTPVKIVVSIALIATAIGGGITYSNKQKALKTEAIYKITLNQVMLLASIQGAKIETDSQEISNVWHSAIFDEVQPITVNGQDAYSFDEALKFKNEEFKSNGEMDALVKGKTVMQSYMDGLVNPPSQDKDAYDLVMKIFTSYNEFEGMVESPSGSLTDYNEKYSTLDESLSSQIKEFQTRYPMAE